MKTESLTDNPLSNFKADTFIVHGGIYCELSIIAGGPLFSGVIGSGFGKDEGAAMADAVSDWRTR